MPITSSEQERFEFLRARDGEASARKWMERTAQIYRSAALQAVDPDAVRGAKGMHWGTIYCESAKECDKFYS